MKTLFCRQEIDKNMLHIRRSREENFNKIKSPNGDKGK